MKKILFSLIALSPITYHLSPISAQPTGAHFLKIPVGPRAVSLGSALTALVDDPSALYWNPAGLVNARRVDFMAMHNVWIAETRENFAGVSVNVSSRVAVGLSYLVFDSGTMDKRDAAGNKLGQFGAQDRVISVAGSFHVAPGVSAGIAFKQISQVLDTAEAKGTAVDLGVQFRPISRLALGASVSNIGQPMKFISESYELPRLSRVGLGLALAPNVNFVASATKNLNGQKEKPDYGFGLEYNLNNLSQSYFWSPVVWRLGYILPTPGKKGIPGAGIGLRILGSEIDYALTPMDDLGLTHKVSLRFSFR